MSAHFKSWSAHLIARNMDASVTFYRDTPGFAGLVYPETRPHAYARLYRDRAHLMIFNLLEYEKAGYLQDNVAATVLSAMPSVRLVIPVGRLQDLCSELRTHGLSTNGVVARSTQGSELEVVDPDGNTVVFFEGPEESASDAG